MSELIKSETKFTVYSPDGENILGVYDDEATALAAANAVQNYQAVMDQRVQISEMDREEPPVTETEPTTPPDHETLMSVDPNHREARSGNGMDEQATEPETT